MSAQGPNVALPPELIASLAGAFYGMLGAGAWIWLQAQLKKAGASAEDLGRGRDAMKSTWTLTPEEARAIGEAGAAYCAWLNLNVTPGMAFAIAVVGPAVVRGAVTYGMVPRQDGASGS